jgi:hypothetical protein
MHFAILARRLNFLISAKAEVPSILPYGQCPIEIQFSAGGMNAPSLVVSASPEGIQRYTADSVVPFPRIVRADPADQASVFASMT